MSSSSSTPQLSTLYQNCALDLASKVSLGLATGAALSFLVFRGPSARKVVTGLGAGFGAGHAWATCSSHLSGHPLCVRITILFLPRSISLLPLCALSEMIFSSFAICLL